MRNLLTQGVEILQLNYLEKWKAAHPQHTCVDLHIVPCPVCEQAKALGLGSALKDSKDDYPYT